MVSDPALATVSITDPSKSAFSVKVSGGGSENNGNYVISSSNGRFSANENTYPIYFFKVVNMDATGIEVEQVSALDDESVYVIVAENAKDQSQLYALTNKGYPATGSNRLEGLSVTVTDGKVKLAASRTDALWKLQKPVNGDSYPSFFSAFMGSMRYYYNTIDPGDMPVETPNIVQALMVYVYPDRVELHMKNYNKWGTINGITVNKELVPYISYREVDLPTGIQGVELKDSYIETVDDIYDIYGRKVDRPQAKGVYIINGQKVLIDR